MKSYQALLAPLAMTLLFVSPAKATMVNPDPSAYGPDDGLQSFSSDSPIWSIELFDVFGVFQQPSTFGFFYLNSDLSLASSYTPIFKPEDQGGIQAAAVIFDQGIVMDLDANTVESVFDVNSGDIGFYYSFLSSTGAPVLLTTIAAINPGGNDYAATFPHLTVDNQYLIGFGDMTGTDPALAYYAIGTPETPVPEPATLWLLGTGLAGLVGVRRKKTKLA